MVKPGVTTIPGARPNVYKHSLRDIAIALGLKPEGKTKTAVFPEHVVNAVKNLIQERNRLASVATVGNGIVKSDKTKLKLTSTNKKKSNAAVISEEANPMNTTANTNSVVKSEDVNPINTTANTNSVVKSEPAVDATKVLNLPRLLERCAHHYLSLKITRVFPKHIILALGAKFQSDVGEMVVIGYRTSHPTYSIAAISHWTANNEKKAINSEDLHFFRKEWVLRQTGGDSAINVCRQENLSTYAKKFEIPTEAITGGFWVTLQKKRRHIQVTDIRKGVRPILIKEIEGRHSWWVSTVMFHNLIADKDAKSI
jgi:hypothetical protein